MKRSLLFLRIFLLLLVIKHSIETSLHHQQKMVSLTSSSSSLINPPVKKGNPRRSISLESISPNLFMKVIGGKASVGNTNDGQPATNAQITAVYPFVDSAGNIYIPGGGPSYSIRKISNSGIITTFGGSGTSSGSGTTGPIASVSFFNPYSVVGDAGVSFLFICDQQYIWRYLAGTGVATVFAGKSTSGYADGGVGTAQFDSPKGLWLNTAGLYIADSYNHRIRMVVSGIVSTVVGTGCTGNTCLASFTGDGGPAASATLRFCSGLYIDTNGKMFIADTNNYRIRLVDTNSIITTFAGSGSVTPYNDKIPATSANMNQPYDVKGDTMGNIYFSDTNLYIIRVVEAFNGLMSTLFGSPGTSGFSSGIAGRSSAISAPKGLWVDSLSAVYFSDLNSIRRSIIVDYPTSQPSGAPSTQPTRQPSMQPTSRPSQPTGQPTSRPLSFPSSIPTNLPSVQPSSRPSRRPSIQPSNQPTAMPTRQPSSLPSAQPTRLPTGQPSRQPSRQPTSGPSSQPSSNPTAQPTRVPSGQPTRQPSENPTSRPSRSPSSHPSQQPTTHPTRQPSASPSSLPSQQPTVHPTRQPSSHPSSQPSRAPTTQPSSRPSSQPTTKPSSQPSRRPSDQPTSQPSSQPIARPSSQPSSQPTERPSRQPSSHPTCQPSSRPSSQPSRQPSTQPTAQPSSQPTAQPRSLPTVQPSSRPSRQPSSRPSSQPTNQPTRFPSVQPSNSPTGKPSKRPSVQPTSRPSRQPVSFPTSQPSCLPTRQPSGQPSSNPSKQPSAQPTCQPSSRPSFVPSGQPSSQPTSQPSTDPSSQPSSLPTRQPTNQPTSQPSFCPSSIPTVIPSSQPSFAPSTEPSNQPTALPSRQPTSSPSTPPSTIPSSQPSSFPSLQPTAFPTSQPTETPTNQPSSSPSSNPTSLPSSSPSSQPTKIPSSQPTVLPSPSPSSQPTSIPTKCPSRSPTSQPSSFPTRIPTMQPSDSPSKQPVSFPSSRPTGQPTSVPSVQPFAFPTAAPQATIYQTNGVLFYLGMTSSSSSNENDQNSIITEGTLGTSYILFGRNFKHQKPFPSTISLGSSSSREFVSEIHKNDGAGIRNDITTRSTTIIGDINGDGFLDLLVGYPLASKCSVYLGNGIDDFASLISTTGESFAILGDPYDGGGFLGWSSIRIGDLNGDGFDEIVVSAIYANTIYVIYGRKEFKENYQNININELTTNDGFKIIGRPEEINFGVSLSLLHQFSNSGGHRDIAITAQLPANGQNIVYILFGSRLFKNVNGGNDIDIESIRNNGSVCFRILTPALSFAGFSLAGIGDVNGDDFDDLAIGSLPYISSTGSGSSSSSRNREQRTYIIFGRAIAKDHGSNNELVISEMKESDGFIINRGGFLVAGVGDVNYDGLPDVMITDYEQWQGQGQGQRSAYLIVSPSNMTFTPSLQPSSMPSLYSSPSPSPSVFLPSSQNHSNSSPLIPSLRPTRVPTVIPSFPTTFTPTRVQYSVGLPTHGKPSFAPTRSPTTGYFRLRGSSRPSFHPTLMPTTNSTEFTEIDCNSERHYEGKNATNYKFLITLTSGSMSITGSEAGGARNLYVLSSCPSDRVNVVITNFRLSTDLISVVHLSEGQSAYSYPTMNEISYSLKGGPLTLFFCSVNKLQVILSSHTQFDLTESNFLFASSENGNRNAIQDSVLASAQIGIALGVLVFLFLCIVVTKNDPQEEWKEKQLSPSHSSGNNKVFKSDSASSSSSSSALSAVLREWQHSFKGSNNSSESKCINSSFFSMTSSSSGENGKKKKRSESVGSESFSHLFYARKDEEEDRDDDDDDEEEEAYDILSSDIEDADSVSSESLDEEQMDDLSEEETNETSELFDEDQFDEEEQEDNDIHPWFLSNEKI
jgi:hypothetical protein